MFLAFEYLQSYVNVFLASKNSSNVSITMRHNVDNREDPDPPACNDPRPGTKRYNYNQCPLTHVLSNCNCPAEEQVH